MPIMVVHHYTMKHRHALLLLVSSLSQNCLQTQKEAIPMFTSQPKKKEILVQKA